MGQLVGVDRRVVRLDGREVGEDGGTVDPLPPEPGVREVAPVVGVDLHGHEVGDAGLGDRANRRATCPAAHPLRRRGSGPGADGQLYAHQA